MCPRNVVDFGAVYIVCVFVYLITCFLLLLELAYFFSCLCFPFLFTSQLSFPFKLAMLSFQARCHKRQLNLGYNLFQFILCCCFLC